MIQKRSRLDVIDNSGAKSVMCIHVYGGYRRRYAKVGDTVLISVKSLRKKRNELQKVKKGDICKAVILGIKGVNVNNIFFKKNYVMLVSLQEKYVGNRLFIPVLNSFRYTKYSKAVTLATGIL
jgi:large subunit ribosomal protein L14